MSERRARTVLVALSAAGALLFAYVTWAALTIGPDIASGGVFQVDWNVYWGGARDLVGGTLYRVPLEADGLVLSAPEFRLPPMSAAWAVPLLGLPVQAGGLVWQVMAAACVAITVAIALDLLTIDRPWIWVGVVIGPLALTLAFLEGLHVGTNNYLMMAMVAGGAWAYLRGRDSLAGTLIGLAIATKLWPITLLVVVLRERRWHVLRWAVGVVVVQGLVLFGWLGFDVLVDFARVMGTDIPPSGLLIGPTGIPGLREVWNSGLGLVVAAGLVLIPARGSIALGLAILAGLAPIPNLWIHYSLTIAFAAALMAVPAVTSRTQRAPQPA